MLRIIMLMVICLSCSGCVGLIAGAIIWDQKRASREKEHAQEKEVGGSKR